MITTLTLNMELENQPLEKEIPLETIIFKYHVELPHLCPHPARCFMQLDDILKLLRWGVFWEQSTDEWNSARSTYLRQLRPSTVLKSPSVETGSMMGFWISKSVSKDVDFCRVREAPMRVGVSFI